MDEAISSMGINDSWLKIALFTSELDKESVEYLKNNKWKYKEPCSYLVDNQGLSNDVAFIIAIKTQNISNSEELDLF